MNYSVKTLPKFDKNLKKLSNKYPSIKKDFKALVESLKKHPQQGTSLGNSCYKIRLSITSKNKGKRGGSRVITHFVIDDNTVFLLAIYDKSEKEFLTNKELIELLKLIP